MARNAISFRVEGLAESEAALKDLVENLGVSNATARNTIKRALIDSAQPIEKAAEAAVRVRTGKLKVSIASGTTLSKRQRRLHTKQSPVEAFVGAGPLPQAHMLEFGTSRQAPQSFLREAVDANVDAVRQRFSGQLKLEVDKTAERAKRKLARLLAKGKG
jgi:HK97 gp10 family phage protein